MEKTIVYKSWSISESITYQENYNEDGKIFSTFAEINKCIFRNGEITDASMVDDFDKDKMMKSYETLLENVKILRPNFVNYRCGSQIYGNVDEYNIVHIQHEDHSKYFPDMVCEWRGKYFVYRDGIYVKANYVNDFDKEFSQNTYAWLGQETLDNCIRQYYLLNKHNLGIVETYGKGDKYVINNSILLFLFDGYDSPIYLNWEMLQDKRESKEKLVRDGSRTKYKFINKHRNVHHFRSDNGLKAWANEYDNLFIIDDPLLVNEIKTEKPIYYKTSIGKCWLWGSKDFNEKMTEAKNRQANY